MGTERHIYDYTSPDLDKEETNMPMAPFGPRSPLMLPATEIQVVNFKLHDPMSN